MKLRKILTPLVIIAAIALILALAFFAQEPPAPTTPPAESVAETPVAEEPVVEETPMIEEAAVEEDPVVEDPVTEELPPAQPQCTVSISCAELLDNMDLLAEEKHMLVPADGLLLPPTAVMLSGGESVFDVVFSAAQANALHMEYTAGSATAYIEGVGNLYEFDAGPTAGWTYSVNGTFPNQDSSTYFVKDGDSIQLIYSLSPKTGQ